MPSFSYTAFDTRGDEKSGVLDATSSEQAVANLKVMGLFPTEVRQGGIDKVEPGLRTGSERVPKPRSTQAASRGLNMNIRLPFLSGVSRKELAVFTRQLAVLLRAGMPLVRGLEVLARQEKNAALREIVTALADQLRSGGTLSEAMAQHPKVFDRLYINMVKAGEAGGVLDTVLDRVARFQEKSLQLRGKIRAAMVYPIIVLTVAATILAGLLVFVVPRFKQIFADLLKGAPLPPLTQAVMGVSELVRSNILLVLGGLVAAWIALKLMRRTPAGSRLWDTALVRAPLFGGLVLKAVIARFTRTLGTLLASGVPILPSLVITRDTCGNARVAGALDLVHDRVKGGEPLARPLEETAVLPPMVTSMVDVGEHTGQLPDMLNKVADIYEEEVDNAVAGLSSLIEPLLILFLAVVVGTIVIALFLPIIRIVQLLT